MVKTVFSGYTNLRFVQILAEVLEQDPYLQRLQIGITDCTDGDDINGTWELEIYDGESERAITTTEEMRIQNILTNTSVAYLINKLLEVEQRAK